MVALYVRCLRWCQLSLFALSPLSDLVMEKSSAPNGLLPAPASIMDKIRHTGQLDDLSLVKSESGHPSLSVSENILLQSQSEMLPISVNKVCRYTELGVCPAVVLAFPMACCAAVVICYCVPGCFGRHLLPVSSSVTCVPGCFGRHLLPVCRGASDVICYLCAGVLRTSSVTCVPGCFGRHLLPVCRGASDVICYLCAGVLRTSSVTCVPGCFGR